MSYIEISKEKMSAVASTLNELLCSYSVYYQNIRSCHWNVEGPNFFQLHGEFEAIYTDARINIDAIAERILTIGHKPNSSISKYLAVSIIDEMESNISDEKMVENILNDQSKLITQMREVIKEASAIDDEGTVDLVASMVGAIEKRTWMLAAWLKKS